MTPENTMKFELPDGGLLQHYAAGSATLPVLVLSDNGGSTNGTGLPPAGEQAWACMLGRSLW